MNRPEQQGRLGLLFYLFAAVMVYAVLFLGMPIAQADLADRRYRDIFLLATGLLGIVGGLSWGKVNKVRPESRRLDDRFLMGAAACLPVYILFQWIPLPVQLVAILSPARGELLRGLEPLFGKQMFASLSISPALTLWHFLLICAYCVLLFAAREFAVRARRQIWVVAAPILVAGGIEAAMGLAQFASGVDTPLKGTFAIRNHLAGFLEMALPLAAAFTLAALGMGRDRRGHGGGRHRRGGREDEEPAERNWLRAAGGLVLTGAMLAVALLTLSRGGFGGLLASMLLIAAFSVGRGMPLWQRFLTAGVLTAVVVGLLFLATPLSLIDRLAEHSSEGRVAVWSEGINVVKEFPLVGTGVGGFESAFLKFKASEGQFVVDYAHNDYLQGLAELGAVGFAIMVALIGSAVVRSARMAAGRNGESPIGSASVGSESADSGALDSTSSSSTETRWVAIGCLASIVAILVHSAVDFNMYVAANTATLAWICGMAAGLTPSQRLRRRTVEVAESLRQGSAYRG